MGFLGSLGRDMKGGTAAYKAFNDQRNKWVDAYLKSKGIAPSISQGATDSEGGGSSGAGFDLDYNEARKKAGAAWLNTLDPATRKKAEAAFSQHSSDMDSINKVGKTAALGVIGASGLGAALTGAGVIGGAAGTPSASAISSAAGMPELGLVPQTGLGGATTAAGGVSATEAAGALGGAAG
jgi:hypothetical protein